MQKPSRPAEEKRISELPPRNHAWHAFIEEPENRQMCHIRDGHETEDTCDDAKDPAEHLQGPFVFEALRASAAVHQVDAWDGE